MNMNNLIEMVNEQFREMGFALMVSVTDGGFYKAQHRIPADNNEISFNDDFDAFTFLRQRAKNKCLASNLAVMLHGTPVQE